MSIHRNCLGFNIWPKSDYGFGNRSQKPTEIGTETVETETVSGIMTLPTKATGKDALYFIVKEKQGEKREC